MKSYSTNEALRKLFISEECTQIEMGYKTDTNKNSIHDWLKGKNQLRFDKLEEIANLLGKRVKIVIEDKPIHKFNNGNGATLCNKCSVIISVGLTDDLYCKDCRKEMLQDIMKDDEELGLYEKPKQETLEEVAEIFTPQLDKWTIKEIFIAGAKWQQEQAKEIEEKNLLEMLHKFGFDYTYNYKGEKTIYKWIPEWFEEYKRLEQFKNK